MKPTIRRLSSIDIDIIIQILVSANLYNKLLQIHSQAPSLLKDNLFHLIQDASSHFYLIQFTQDHAGIIGFSHYPTLYQSQSTETELTLYLWFHKKTILSFYSNIEEIIRNKLLENNQRNEGSYEIHCYVTQGDTIVEGFMRILGNISREQYKLPYCHYIIRPVKIHPHNTQSPSHHSVIHHVDMTSENPSHHSVIHHVEMTNGNQIYIKRDDRLPFSFGGNKARKAIQYFYEVLEGNYDTVVTYGSHRSNHCRVIANLCYKHRLRCVIISPYATADDSASAEEMNLNQKLIQLSGAQVVECDVTEVRETIAYTIEGLEKNSAKPYFISGGGHGNLGTHAYVIGYSEIVAWSMESGIDFDYIFLASGTGTTQAGLVVGQALHPERSTRIIGISIARAQEYGRSVVHQSVVDYMEASGLNIPMIDLEAIEFYDYYSLTPYGKTDDRINYTAQRLYLEHSIPLSTTYTAKAYAGMESFIEVNDLTGQNILFLHTGGIPLFFDNLSTHILKL